MSSPKLTVSIAVVGDGNTSTKLDFTGLSISEARDCLAQAIHALKTEYIEMIEHHFPRDYGKLTPGTWAYKAATLGVLERDPPWKGAR